MQNGLLEMNPTPVQPAFKHPVQHEENTAAGPASVLIREAIRRTRSLDYRVAKRLLDLAVCLSLLLLLGPLLLFLAIVVRLSSHGPVLYREVRIGRFGRQFTIYKFRSMYTREHLVQQMGYDECELAQLRRRQHGKVTADPRITPIGRFLRVTSLDELPQILNVVRGDMSLVGPRPVVAAELLCYRDQASLYKLVTPGISGLWQISGRSNLTFEERIQLDVRYCVEWTFLNDLTILWKTLPAVLNRHGAY